jgi:hypothetical protein
MIIYSSVFCVRFCLICKVAMDVKANGEYCYGGKNALRHFYRSMDVFRRLMFKHWFFRVARIFFLAIKHHVACQKYHYFGWILPLVLLLLKECLNVFLLNDSDTKRGEDYTENERGSQNVMRALFCQNCNWLFNLILEFTSCIKILVSLQLMLQGWLLLWYFLHIDSSKVTNLENFMPNTVCAHIVSFIHFVCDTWNIPTLVMPVLSWHWLFHFCFFSFAEICVCLYFHRYYIIWLSLWKYNSAYIIMFLCSE